MDRKLDWDAPSPFSLDELEGLDRVPVEIAETIEQLNFLPVSFQVDQVADPYIEENAETSFADPLQAIENALQSLNQTHDDPLLKIENALQNLNQNNAALDNRSEPHYAQRGEGGVQGPLLATQQSAAQRGPAHSPAQQGAAPQSAAQQSAARQSSTVSHECFNTDKLRRTLTVSSLGDVPDIARFYTDVMGQIHELADETRLRAERNDVVQLEVVGENVRDYITVTVDEDGENIFPAFENLLDRLVQSNNSIVANESLEFIVQVVQNPRGGGKRSLEKTLDCEILRKKRRHLYVVENRNDQLCFAINLAHVSDPKLTDRECERQGREWQCRAELDTQTPVTFSDIAKFEVILSRKIVVFYRNGHDQPLSHFETNSEGSNPLFLFLQANHYYGIKNVKAFVGTQFFCNYCYKGFNNFYVHSCKGYCQVCNDPVCPTEEFRPLNCSDCQRKCRSAACLARHKKAKLGTTYSLCNLVKKCLKCGLCYYISMSTGKTLHRCRGLNCKVCGEKLESDTGKHYCYIQPLPREKKHPDVVFYDFETFVNERGEHVPFLVVAKSLNGVYEEFYGLDCVKSFLLHFRSKRFANHVFVAHNARRFDSYLVLKVMLNEGISPKGILMTGSKILCLQDPHYHLKFIDSLSFLTMRLSAMPKALGFTDQSKGYFPHKFSSKKHLGYVGPYPLPSHYGVERMTQCEQEEFYRWYNNVRQGTFNFREEAVRYCKNDVDILSKGCSVFREEFLCETGVDPFGCITIASACMKVFLTNFLSPNSLAIPCPYNYMQQCKRFSNASIQWLEWVMHKEKIFIQHALNAGEKQLGRYFVDGYAEVSGVKIVWEFHGCFYHGCPRCLNPAESCPLRGKTYGEIHAASEVRVQTLESEHGVRVVIMREHEWDELKKSCDEVKQFLSVLNPPEPLSPRSALYGGRTSALKLRHTAGPNETVYYADVTSLYPYVNSKCDYPLGHPTIIYEDFRDPRDYFGFVKATVYPPRRLFFPVLPYKSAGGKLLFPLCRTCAEDNYQAGPCMHDDEARALTGVWVTAEFNKALEQGYRVSKITEVWHFEKRSNSVFVDYIHTFLKGKQEASGYPPEATDQESREKYIRDYQIHQGILLDANKIEVNPAKRQVAKLCLNSFWGKFAQRHNMLQTSIISKPKDLFSFLFSGKYEVEYFNVLDDKKALIQWKHRGVYPPGKTSNIFIAAFTTAYARLKLYSYLEKLQERVLYIDTDSLIYVVREGESPLEVGNYLGDLTDELGGDSIQEFVSAGPKTYAYQTRNQKKVVMRAKGITQTRECSERVNFDSVRELVEGYLQGSKEGVIVTPQHDIVRDKKSITLKNRSFFKKFKVVYDKRRLFADGTTLPFGY